MPPLIRYRSLSKTIIRAIKTFPSVVVTGPRQSGKTTLLRSLFGAKYDYVSLENPDTRMRAKDDPLGFLQQHERPLIIDEIQYVPELLSYIKTDIDRRRTPGRYILTGSQNFVLMQGISQSLAGRIAVLSLLPFSHAERIGAGDRAAPVSKLLSRLPEKSSRPADQDDIAALILRGNYPELATNKRVDRRLWCGSYISTFIERDIRNLAHVGDLNQFERLLRLCAVRTGQILNISELAKEIGVSLPTAKRWLSVLEASYQIFLLTPFYKNIGKRLIKSPKIYFNDTALASYLLGLNDKQALQGSPHYPHLFETYIVIDFLKRFLNFGDLPSLYYFRTRDGMEIDLTLEVNQKLHLFEIKSGHTITPQHAVSLSKAVHDLGALVGKFGIISCSQESFPLKGDIHNYRWQDILSQ